MEIPKTLKSKVLAQWLFTGMSRDEIAVANNISSGAVSAINQEARENIHDLDLMRELAVGMKKAGLNIIDLSSAIRIHHRMERLGITLELAESILEKIHIHCYANKIEVEPLLLKVVKQLEQLESVGISVNEFDSFIKQKTNELVRLDSECKEMTEKRNIQARVYNTTVRELEEFKDLRPIHEKLKKALEAIALRDEVITDLERQIKELKSNQPQ